VKSFLRATAAMAVVLCASSCAAGDRSPDAMRRVESGSPTASPAEGVADEHPLGLADADFWGDYTRTQEETLGYLDGIGFHGLLVDLPRTVALGKRGTVPLVGWYVRTFREDGQRDLEGQAVAVAVDLRTGELRAALALAGGKPRPQPAPTDGQDPGDGVRSEMFETDLRRVLDLPPRPGRYAAAVILNDWVSNVVTTTLVDGAPADDARADGRATAWPPAAAGDDLPDYRRRPDSPAVPDGVAIVLAAAREVPAGGPLVIRGSFRLPLPAHERIAARDQTGVSGPRAVLPIALVVTGTEDPGPFPVELRVPVYAVDGDQAIGHFAVDLVTLGRLPHAPTSYFVHAFSRGVAAASVRIAMVAGDVR